MSTFAEGAKFITQVYLQLKEAYEGMYRMYSRAGLAGVGAGASLHALALLKKLKPIYLFSRSESYSL